MALRGQPHRLYRAFLLAFNVLLMVIAGSVASVGLFAFSERRRPGVSTTRAMTDCVLWNLSQMRLALQLRTLYVVARNIIMAVPVLRPRGFNAKYVLETAVFC